MTKKIAPKPPADKPQSRDKCGKFQSGSLGDLKHLLMDAITGHDGSVALEQEDLKDLLAVVEGAELGIPSPRTFAIPDPAKREILCKVASGMGIYAVRPEADIYRAVKGIHGVLTLLTMVDQEGTHVYIKEGIELLTDLLESLIKHKQGAIQ